MKRALILPVLLLCFQWLMADQLVFIQTGNSQQIRQLIENPAIKVHYTSDDFVIATVDFVPKEPHKLLDADAWSNGKRYYFLNVPQPKMQQALNDIVSKAVILHQGPGWVIVSTSDPTAPITPYHHNGIVRIMPEAISLPKDISAWLSRNINPDPFVQQLISQVNPLNITATTQHLEDYGTRNAYQPQSVAAQNWIKDKFLSYGLSVEIMDFAMPNGAASDNVIATLPGTKYPNEYVICGAHYDSYASGSTAPGADDNASGTAAVLEIARIMSNYSFDRTVIFCAFSGEEYGLYGSAAYALRAKNQGMNIHGYFNLDMIGYLKPGNTTIKSSLIYPQSAAPLAQFYTQVCATYLPDFVVTPGSLSGGDSDHTSFNNNGFMGIFPFEAVPDYSPYIHTGNDLVGPSYNNAAQAAIFTKATLASLATMANRLNPPQNLVATAGSNFVKLNWATLPDAAYFKIYRNGVVLDSTSNNRFFDLQVSNGVNYTYKLTAVYQQTLQESPPSNEVNVVPMPPMMLPVTMTFEDGAGYWQFTQQWGLSTTQAYSPTHSISESPVGNYTNNTTSYAYLRPIDLSQGYTSAELSFWTRYDLETNYDYVYLEASTNGTAWTQLAQFNGAQNTWQKRTYSLNQYLSQSWLQLRFKFTSDASVVKDGIYIDDFQLLTTGGYQMQYALLYPGWNSLGSAVAPVQSDLDQLFAPLGNDLIAVQSAGGLYYPAGSINTLGNWQPAKGYKVRMAAPAVLTIAGPDAAPLAIDLQAGWNLVPVTVKCPVNLSGWLPEGIIVKEVGATGVFWPEAGISSLSQLQPGRAYYMFTPQATQINFTPCNAVTGEHNGNVALRNDETIPTGDSHLLLISAAALTQATQAGDILMAFNASGTLAGVATVESVEQPMVVTVFGYDSIAPVIQGFITGEAFILKRLRGTELQPLEATYDPTFPQFNTYAHQGLSKVTSLNLILGITENSNILTVYPNPSSGIVYLEGLHDDAHVTIYDNQGRQMMSKNFTNEKQIDLSQLLDGTYIMVIRTQQQVKIAKVLLRK
ncbi:MAG TPA: M28 family peptidase [Bacteroidales bacterium]|nr:M28 family peptidase [Bacteroidales bacterium]